MSGLHNMTERILDPNLFGAIAGLRSQLVMLVNVGRLPRIAYPNIRHSDCRKIPIFIYHVLRKLSFLDLVLVVQHENREFGLLRSALLLSGRLDILLQFFDCVLEGLPTIIDLVNYRYALANQIGHLEGGQIKPLCSCDLCARSLDGI